MTSILGKDKLDTAPVDRRPSTMDRQAVGPFSTLLSSSGLERADRI